MTKSVDALCYKFIDLAQAPDTPGLYAWYGSLALYPADYKDDIADGVNLGVMRLRESLARHTARFDPRPRRLAGRAEFGARWRGELQDTGRISIRRKILGSTNTAGEIERIFDSATATANLRQELVLLLQSVQPTLTAPIYIGVTNSLKRRLREHSSLYNDLKDAASRDPDKLAELKRNIENQRTEFAHRVVAAEFEPENLFVYVWPYSSSLTPVETDNLLKSAEWLLNRWHRPILGRE